MNSQSRSYHYPFEKIAAELRSHTNTNSNFDKLAYSASLLNGLTNHNYLIKFKKKQFVLRLSGKNRRLLGITRSREYVISQIAAKENIGAPVRCFI